MILRIFFTHGEPVQIHNLTIEECRQIIADVEQGPVMLTTKGERLIWLNPAHIVRMATDNDA
jgi:hypothetical protein